MSNTKRRGNAGVTGPPSGDNPPSHPRQPASPGAPDSPSNRASRHRSRDTKGQFASARPLPTLDDLLASFGETWRAWRTLAIAADGGAPRVESEAAPDGGTPLSDPEPTTGPAHHAQFFFDSELFKSCTGRTSPPSAPTREVWVQAGRGSGKTRAAAAAVVAAAIRDYPTLAPGERGKCFLLAQNRQAARQAFGYVAGILRADPRLRRLIENETKHRLELRNGIDIEVQTASYKHTRGFSIVACVADEIAFWWTEANAANADIEIINALRPGLARVPNSTLWAISSPYAPRGALHEAHKTYFGTDSDEVLYWKAPTPTMNPTFNQSEIDRAMQEDAVRARSEYDAEFRREGDSYISAEALDAVLATDRVVLPPSRRTRYVAFVDAAGGSGGDSAALAVAHVEKRRTATDEEGRPVLASIVVVDHVSEVRPPFSPESTLEDFTKVLQAYGVSKCTGDRWSGDFVRDILSKHGVVFSPSLRTKSDLYRELLPLITSGRVELLDNGRLRNQLLNLERRASASGRDSIDHARGAHDDIANAVAGAVVLAAEKGRSHRAHGTPDHPGHQILVLGEGTFFCVGRDAHGQCIRGSKSRANDTYHYSDRLWDELQERARGSAPPVIHLREEK